MFENEKFCKLFYKVSLIFTIFMALLTISASVIVLMPGENASFEVSQLIVPGICLVFTIIGAICMKVWKKKF